MPVMVPTDLFERALLLLRDDLRSFVECCAKLAPAEGYYVPVPGSVDPDALAETEARLELVRAMERLGGHIAGTPEPGWLADLIEGRWALS